VHGSGSCAERGGPISVDFDMSANTDAVTALERQFWTDCNNPEFFARHFADDGIAVFEPGGVIAKEQSLRMSSTSKPWLDVKMDEIATRELAPNCVAITYRGSGRRDGDAEVYRARISSIYLHRQGRWQLGFTTHQRLADA
jgi:hypothetical protein